METTLKMGTKEIADNLVKWCNKGEWQRAYQELYSPKVISIEEEGLPNMAYLEGIEAVLHKGEWWAHNFEVHSSKASDPIIADNWFTVKFEMDSTHKTTGHRSKSTEIAVYKVKDGKIVKEHFFYDMKA